MVARKKSTSVQRKVETPDRIPVGGHRDKLTVRGLDPNFSYRWVEDDSEQGQRIFEFLQGGWEFEDPKRVQVGQHYVYTTEGIGSVVRRPSGGRYVFLMRIPMKLYKEDQKAKQRDIDALEQDMLRERDPSSGDGQYGGGKITRSF